MEYVYCETICHMKKNNKRKVIGFFHTCSAWRNSCSSSPMDFFSFLSMLQYCRILLSSTSDSPPSTLPEKCTKSRNESLSTIIRHCQAKIIFPQEAFYHPDWLMVTPVLANMILKDDTEQTSQSGDLRQLADMSSDHENRPCHDLYHRHQPSDF